MKDQQDRQQIIFFTAVCTYLPMIAILVEGTELDFVLTLSLSPHLCATEQSVRAV